MKFKEFITKNIKYIIIIAIIIIVIILLINNLPKNNNHKDKYIISNMEEFENKLEMKKDMLIYVSSRDCEICDTSDNMIKFYKEAYNLNFYTIDINELSNTEIIKYFDLEAMSLEVPSVIYIKDGLFKAIDNKILNEDYFRDYLMEYGFLDKSYYENDYRINYDEFKDMYDSPNKNIILFYNYGDNVYVIGEKTKKEKQLDKDKIRKYLLKLSNEYSFKYRIVFYSSEGSDDIYKEVMSSINKEEINGPFIVITQDNKVLDYSIPKSTSDISDFLKKNVIY